MNMRVYLDTVAERIDERSHLPTPWNPKQIDPALLTFDEYLRIANHDGKWHDSEAYTTTLVRMNAETYLGRPNFPIFLKRVRIKGLEFEFRIKAKRKDYTHVDTEGEYVRGENGRFVDMTDEEIAAQGLRPTDFIIGVFDEDGQCCAATQDEWGCMLIRVADEYRGFGLGPILGKIARTFEPDKTSGGFTSHGYANFVKIHREMVREALTTGRYGDLIRAGRITVQRVREIVDSAKLQIKPRKAQGNLGSRDPADWLLYVDDGCYVLYDRKLREIVEESGDEVWRWAERMIKGYLLIRIPHKHGLVVRFGGESEAIKRNLLTIGAGYCAGEGVPFAVDEEDLHLLDPARIEVGPIHHRSGMRRADARLTGAALPLAGVAKQERAFRAGFDKYGEFKQWVLELADAKYRPES